MSTVEIFDGKVGSYTENSEPNPLTYYGNSKVIVENYLKKNYQKSKPPIVKKSFWSKTAKIARIAEMISFFYQHGPNVKK